MDIKDTIQLLGHKADQVGKTVRETCPVCRAPHERTLAITRTDAGLVYICPRAKCTLGSGFIPNNPGEVQYDRAEKHPRYFKYPLQPLSRRLAAWLEDRYHIPRQLMFKNEFKYDYTYNRLYMPLFDVNGEMYGAQLRRLPTMFIHRTMCDTAHALTKPKADNYVWNHNTPMLHFPVGSRRNTGELVLVEDHLSALRLSPYCFVAATIGSMPTTSVMAAYMRTLAQVLVAIPDPDALFKTFALKKDYGSMFDRMDVVAVKDDVKDLTTEEFNELAQLLFFIEEAS